MPRRARGPRGRRCRRRYRRTGWLARGARAERTVEVDAFCSWSACRMKMRSMALRQDRDWAFQSSAGHREAHAAGSSRGRGQLARGCTNGSTCGSTVEGSAPPIVGILATIQCAGDHPLVGIIDVGAVVIEGREGSRRRRVMIAIGVSILDGSSLKKPVELVMQHGVIDDVVLEIGEFVEVAMAVHRSAAGSRPRGMLDFSASSLDRIAAVRAGCRRRRRCSGDLAFAGWRSR